MLSASETASSAPVRPRAPVFAFISLLLFAGGAVAGAWSFVSKEAIQWSPGARRMPEGPVHTRIMRYEAALSRGAVAWFVTRDDWDGAASTRPGWFRMRGRPTSLVIEPLPQDRTNVRVAGFQWYHGVFPGAVPGQLARDVRVVVVPLWPWLVVTAIPAWLWWRRHRRRQIGSRGFPVTAGARE